MTVGVPQSLTKLFAMLHQLVRKVLVLSVNKSFLVLFISVETNKRVKIPKTLLKQDLVNWLDHICGADSTTAKSL